MRKKEKKNQGKKKKHEVWIHSQSASLRAAQFNSMFMPKIILHYIPRRRNRPSIPQIPIFVDMLKKNKLKLSEGFCKEQIN